MTHTSETRSAGRRGTWIILALVALVAIVCLVLYMNNNGRDDTDAVAPASASVDDEGASQAAREAAADTGQALKAAGSDVVAGARDAAGATAEAARDTAQAAENAVERSTDGNPDSDNNERR